MVNETAVPPQSKNEGSLSEGKGSKPAAEGSHLTVASRLINAAINLEKIKGGTKGPSTSKEGPRVDHNPEAAGRA